MTQLRRIVPMLLVATLMPGMVSAAATPARIVFGPHGVSGVNLGESAAAATRTFDHLLGRASSPARPTPALANCGVSATESWRGFRVYLERARVVGFSLGPAGEPLGTTTRGLRVGDTLARARDLYGSALSTSLNQGGAWYASPGARGLRGFLIPSGPPARASSRIQTLDLGDVGCPAMSP